jgi:hypothetical protein
MVDFYDVSPPEPEECPESCPHRPEFGDPRDCDRDCIYDIDAETRGDREYHRRVDEGEMR